MRRASAIDDVFLGFLARLLGRGGTSQPKESRSRRSLLLLSVLLLGMGSNGCLGCSSETAAPSVSASASASASAKASAKALRQRFPDQAAEVLEQGEALGFVATEEGFALTAPPAQGALSNEVSVNLPRDGRGAIRLRGFGGVEVRVREIGVEGEGAIAEQAVSSLVQLPPELMIHDTATGKVDAAAA